jgi:hypothetical protein
VVRIFLWRSSCWISHKSFLTWLRRILAAESNRLYQSLYWHRKFGPFRSSCAGEASIKTASIGRNRLACPQGLLSPQSPKLFANETLYQLSYTPNTINSRDLLSNFRSTKNTCLYRFQQRRESWYRPASPKHPACSMSEIIISINRNYYGVNKVRGKNKTITLRARNLAS